MPYIPSFIQPASADDQARWREQSLRYRLLTGKQLPDVRDEIEGMFSQEIAADITINPDLSRNALRLIYQQLNVAYLEPPDVRAEGVEDMAPIITPLLWAQQQQTALYTLAIQESLVRVDWKHWLDAKETSYRPISPDLVVIGKADKLKAAPGVQVVHLDGEEVTQGGDRYSIAHISSAGMYDLGWIRRK